MRSHSFFFGHFFSTALVTVTLAALAPALYAQPLPAVVVAPATLQDFQGSATFTGRLSAIQKVAIQARATGFIQSVDFTEGTEITSGTLLYQIEPDLYQAKLKQIEGQLVAARATKDLSVLERNRQAKLVKRHATSQAQLDQAVASVGQAEGNIMMLEAQRSQARLDLSYTEITAPFDGIIGLAKFDVGALVGPSSGSLVTLTRSDPIYAEFSIPTTVLQNYKAAVARGELSTKGTVLLRLANGADYRQPGKINYIDASVAEGTDSVLIRASFPNGDNQLRDGELVTVILKQSQSKPVLAIPAQAISRDLSGSFVMIVGDDGTVSRRTIKVSSTVQGMTAVISGLKEGEKVITEGLNKVRPGIKVDAKIATASPEKG